MLPVNGNVNAMPRKVSCKLVIGGNTITDVKLLTYSSDWSGDITIGQVVSSYISATIPTPSFSLTSANVSHSMGIGDPVEWVAIGQYTVDKNSIRTRQGYTSFSAFDKLHDTVNTYTANAAYAETVQGLCNDVCAQIGITSIGSLGNIGAVAVEKESLNGYTLRDVLGFVAAICGKNAYVNASNQLELRWFSSTSYTADNTRANVPYIGEGNCTIGRLICQGADGTYTYGSGEGIYFTCPLVTQDNQASILSYLYGLLAGFSYRKADVDIQYGNFCLQSGDIITVTTTGSSLTIPIMSNSFSYDGGLSSAVSAYGVSDYSGTANNAEHSLSNRRVQQLMETKRTITGLQADIAYASALITGATGGVMRINMGGNGKPAELLILDTGDIATAQRVFRLNENGLGYSDTGYNGSYDTAITYDGLIVADRIAGNKISGVKLETFNDSPTPVAGHNTHIMIEGGSYTINKVVVNAAGEMSSAPDPVAEFRYYDNVDSLGTHYDVTAIEVQQGGVFTIGMPGNGEYIYYSDLSAPGIPSGATKHNFFGGDMSVFGDIKFNSGATDSLNALKATVDSMLAALVGINAALDDLDRRVTALENQ